MLCLHLTLSAGHKKNGDHPVLQCAAAHSHLAMLQQVRYYSDSFLRPYMVMDVYIPLYVSFRVYIALGSRRNIAARTVLYAHPVQLHTSS